MDREKMLMIDQELDSSEVAALCFLCSDVLHRKRLESVKDATTLFLRLEERGLMENSSFLLKLLKTIRRADLLSILEADASPSAETDPTPTLSDYRVMLYKIHEDITDDDVVRLKFLLSDRLKRRQLDECKTALDVFVEMEKDGLLSSTKVDELQRVLQNVDRQVAVTLQHYADELIRQYQNPSPEVIMVPQRASTPEFNSISETQPSNDRQYVYSDAETADPAPLKPIDIHSHKVKMLPSLVSEEEYYTLKHVPRGVCFVINNEHFIGELGQRRGTEEDEKTLQSLFTRLGFKVIIRNDLTAQQIREELNALSMTDFMKHDALVVCVLSHGLNGTVYGTDEKEVALRELTQPFTSRRVPTLAMKPKLFFIQACQGRSYQKGAIPCPPTLNEEEDDKRSSLEEDAGPVQSETVPADADFLLGMATVPEYKSFRHIAKGSIFIQELCKQLEQSAQSAEPDDLLSIMTRVNREVSRGVFNSYKQMPEPKYTLTKKVVLKFVNMD